MSAATRSRCLPPLLLMAAGLLVGACLPQPSGPADNFIGLKAAAEKIAKERAAEAPKPAQTPAPQPPAPALPPVPPPPPTSGPPLRLTLPEAILLGMENNLALQVERFKPVIQQTFEETQRAVFDPVFKAGTSLSRTKVPTEFVSIPRQSTKLPDFEDTRLAQASAEIDEFLPTGTTIQAKVTSSMEHLFHDHNDSTRFGLTVTQALLQGCGTEVNLAALRQAKLDTQSSQYELRGTAESLLANIEETYWDYSLAQRQIDIVTESLKLAQKQMDDTQVRIKFGKLADTELAAAEAEVASRRSDLIDANSALAKVRLNLTKLLNPPGGNLWSRDIVIDVPAGLPDTTLDDVEAHAQVGLSMRADLNQARLQVLRGDLDVVKTANGLLPVLNAFITLGRTGYAHVLGGTFRNAVNGDSFDATVGVTFQQALGNRDARAQYKRATVTHRQLLEAVDNLAETVQVDVRSAYIEVNRNKEQIVATAATRKLKEEVLRSETEKLNVGKSTTFLVAQAQRDFLVSQLAEVQAKVALLKGLVELYRLEGSLLERRGLAAPGGKKIDLQPPKEWGYHD